MPGPAAVINPVSGAPQTVFTNSLLVAPLIAQVLDANGNPVSGVTVTFLPQGQGASVSFAGGVATAVTDGTGKATSVMMTANSIPGDFTVLAWVGAGLPGPGSVGPATFRLTSSQSGVFTNKAAIPAVWTTAKTQLSQLLTDLATVVTDLANLEASRDTLYSLGASDVADWLSTQIRQARVGYQPRVSAAGGPTPQVIALQAPNPSVARDTTATDQRPVTVTQTAQFCGLS